MDWFKVPGKPGEHMAVTVLAAWAEDPWTQSLNQLINAVQMHKGDICDVVAALLVLAVTGTFFSKRPRTTGSVVCAWLAWFAWQLALGRSTAWQEVLQHAEAAARSTAQAVQANGEMLAAWVTLVLPAVHDLSPSQLRPWCLVYPLLVQLAALLQWLWTSMSWEQRCILALCSMGIGGATYAFVLLWRSRSWLKHNSKAFLDSAKNVLFHASFIVVCPMVWFAASLCPSDFVPGMAFFVLGTLLPVWWTSRALIQHHHEKAADVEAQNSSSSGWLNMSMPRWPGTFSPSSDLEEEMKYLLSYWACWPLLCAVQFSLSQLPDTAKAAKPGGEGLLVALAMWLQFWRGSFLAPYLFTLLTSLLSHTIDSLCNVLEAGRRALAATLQRPAFSLHMLSLCPQERWVMLVAGVLLLFVCLEVASVVSVLITVALLFGIGLESARCVAGKATQMYANRLSFWVLVNVWFWMLRVPVLGIVLSVWSPVVFGLAFVGGETAFNTLTGLLLHMLALIVSGLNRWCDQCTAQAPLQESLLRNDQDDAEQMEAASAAHAVAETDESCQLTGQPVCAGLRLEESVSISPVQEQSDFPPMPDSAGECLVPLPSEAAEVPQQYLPETEQDTELDKTDMLASASGASAIAIQDDSLEYADFNVHAAKEGETVAAKSTDDEASAA